MTQSVPFFNYPALFEQNEERYMEIIRDVLSRGAYILQAELESFEKNLCEFLDVKHAFGVADGTNAMVISLIAAGVKAGDEVILPGHTYVATANAIQFIGAKAVVVECLDDHMIDPDSIRQAITSKTTCIMPVQVNGRTADMDSVCAIAKEFGLLIVEDSAQALGSKFKGQSAGSFGSAGTFSFYPAKVLGCFGDGGAVITNDDTIADKLYLLRDHGRNRDGEVVGWGTNSRLDNLQAAILDFKLKTFSADIDRRREIAARYEDGLNGLAELALPPAPDDGNHFDVFQNYELEAENRDDLKEYLASKKVGTIVQFGGKAIHQYPLGIDQSLPITESRYKKMLLLPLHTAMSDGDVDYVIEQVTSFYR